MEDFDSKILTNFDALLQNKQLQIIKAAIPYMQPLTQKPLSVYVKMIELNNTLNLFEKENADLNICSGENAEDNISNMLNDIKCFCDEKEKENIEFILNFFSTIQIYRTYINNYDNKDNDTDNNNINIIKNLLTPEQQNMFDTYQTIFNNE